MSTRNPEIIIIGAGLTGLTLAYYLKKAGKNVLLLEKETKIGGVIQTHRENGFVFESGPNTGVIGNPEVAELFEDMSPNCELEIANPKAKSRWVWKNGKWNALPSGLASAVSTPLFTMGDKLRILGEPFRKKGTNENESVANMVKRRLGKSFLDYAVDPFVSGIYAGDPEKLITKYALPKLYALENNYGSFIRGSIKKAKLHKTERDKKASREVFSAKGGLGNLIHALANGIDEDNIFLGCQNIMVDYQGSKLEVSFDLDGINKKLKASKIVTTFGGDGIEKVLPFIPEMLINPVKDMEYARVVQVIMGYSNWKGRELNAFGGLVPSKEKRDILGILFTSSFFEDRCPEGGAVLSVFMGGVKKPGMVEMNDAEIKELVLNEVMETLEDMHYKPDMIRIFRYLKAIPQYTISSKQRLLAIENIQKEYPGLIMAGNIRDGIGMADRIKQAVDIANELSN